MPLPGVFPRSLCLIATHGEGLITPITTDWGQLTEPSSAFRRSLLSVLKDADLSQNSHGGGAKRPSFRQIGRVSRAKSAYCDGMGGGSSALMRQIGGGWAGLLRRGGRGQSASGALLRQIGGRPLRAWKEPFLRRNSPIWFQNSADVGLHTCDYDRLGGGSAVDKGPIATNWGLVRRMGRGRRCCR